MLRALLCAIAMLPCLLCGQVRDGYVYEGIDLVGYARLHVYSDRVYGRFVIFSDPGFDFLDLDRGRKNRCEGLWQGFYNPRDSEPVSAFWLEWGGWQYWFFAIKQKTYFARLGSNT